jgi:integrase
MRRNCPGAKEDNVAIYRPTKDTKVWWYDFIFEGQRVRESAKTRSKTVAKDAERVRRREIEESYNGIKRRNRGQLFSVAADEWLTLKALTLATSSQRIERHNLKHLRPHFEKRLVTDIQAKDVNRYQQSRLAEGASPKTINLEVGSLRAILRRHRVCAEIQQDIRMLATRDDVGHAITADEEAALLSECLNSWSRCLYPAVMIALNTGMRYSEIRLLQWSQLNFVDHFITVGKSKTRTGTGRVIPLNARLQGVMQMWAANFPHRQPSHYVFPFEKYGAKGREEIFGFAAGVVAYDTDPSRPIGDWKEAWEKAKERAGAILAGGSNEPQLTKVGRLQGEEAKLRKSARGKDENANHALKCRFHDLRHSAVTRLLEAGIPYPVVANIMGWSAATAIRMAKRYGHIGHKAMRDAMEVLGDKRNSGRVPQEVPKVASQ